MKRFFKFLITIYVLGLASACDQQTEADTTNTPTINTEKYEIAKAISDFMLYENEAPKWSKYASLVEENMYGLRWITDGVEAIESNRTIDDSKFTVSFREASALYWVGGAPLKKLHRTVESVSWKVALQGAGLPTKTIPSRVEFSPLCPTVECQFDFLKSAEIVSDLKLAKWCVLTRPSFSHETYAVEYPNKKPAYLIIEKSWGSGGTTTTLYLAYIAISKVGEKCTSEGI